MSLFRKNTMGYVADGSHTDAGASGLSTQHMVGTLALVTFLLWVGAGSVLPLLPKYLHLHGGSDGVIGAVMASYFVAALVCQYPVARLADSWGRLRVLMGGLVAYAVGTFGFLLHFAPSIDVGLRALQGIGAGTTQLASLAMICGSVGLFGRGRAIGTIYGAQLGGTAIGPLVGSLLGVGLMDDLFAFAGITALLAIVMVLVRPSLAAHDRAHFSAQEELGGRFPQLNRSLVGAVVAAGGLGFLFGVYETCWTLLLDLRHAKDWQIGLSWTLFAAPFVVMSRPGGWLADHLDRRRLVVASLSVSIGLCALYPFLHMLTLLLVLGALEGVGVAVALPCAQSLLTQFSSPKEMGRVQGMFSTAQTGAIAISAGAGGALFGVTPWVPFVAGAAGSAIAAGCLMVIWRPVQGRATQVSGFNPAPSPLVSPAVSSSLDGAMMRG